MAINRLAHRLFSFFLFANILKGYRNRTSLMKIKVAQGYVIGVKKTRLVSMGVLGVLISLALFVSGLFLIQAALFTYSMWSNEVKFNAALVLGIVEFAWAGSILFYLFREEAWIKFSGMDRVINSIIENEEDRKGDRDETKASEKKRA